MQVTYLSKDTQNEFIECCADSVLKRLLKGIEDIKYYALSQEKLGCHNYVFAVDCSVAYMTESCLA